MSKALSEQTIKEHGFNEEKMGGEGLVTMGRLCAVAATNGDGTAREKLDTGTEKSVEQLVLLESQLPSLGIEIMEVTTLADKETVEAEAGHAAHLAPIESLEPSAQNGNDEDNKELDGQTREMCSGLESRSQAEAVSAEGTKVQSSSTRQGRRRGSDLDGTWTDWPVLGDGWKRKEVSRRSGYSVGKTDTYYKTPSGHRVRSKPQMAKYIAGTIDITMFDYKSGIFLDDNNAKKMKCQEEDTFVTMEESSTPEMRLTPETESTVDGSCSPAPIHSNAQSDAPSPRKEPLTPPRVIVVPQNALSPRITQTPQRNSISPASSNSLTLSAHGSFMESPSTRRLSGLSDTPSLALEDFSPRRLTVPMTPIREPPYAPLSPPWLDPALAPLSPMSSPERVCTPTLQDQGSADTRPPSADTHTTNPLGVSHSHNPMMPYNGLRTPPDYASRPLLCTCMNCGCSFHDMDQGGPSHTPFCPHCQPGEKPPCTQNIVFRKVGPGQWALGRSSQEEHEDADEAKKTKKTSKTLRQKSRSSTRRWPYYEENKQSKRLSGSQHSDAEDFTVDFNNDDTESPPASPRGQSKKRNRRACWKCAACLRTTDCGKCDFCMDKPKFGGHNKKRQKCRLRQCQSHAMPHLLPFQLNHSKNALSGVRGKNRNRNTNLRRVHKLHASWEDFDITDGDDDDDEEGYIGTLRPGVYHIENDGAPAEEDEEELVSLRAAQMARVLSAMNFDHSRDKLGRERLCDSTFPVQGPEVMYNQPEGPLSYGGPLTLLPHVVNGGPGLCEDVEVTIVEVDAEEPCAQDVTPVITEIFSLAEGTQPCEGTEQELLRLLESLRRAVLPAHWVGVMATGPRLQLLQCSKLSTMADTVLHIEPGFSYRVTVQDQPLLPTHPLFEHRLARLASVPDIVALLLDLEGYAVCQGYPAHGLRLSQEPVLHVRSAACELLVSQSEERCDRCDVTSLVL